MRPSAAQAVLVTAEQDPRDHRAQAHDVVWTIVEPSRVTRGRHLHALASSPQGMSRSMHVRRYLERWDSERE